MERVYAPLKADPATGISWKELNEAISKAMQNYCAEQKRDELLLSGLELLGRYEREIVPQCAASNPHELMRLLEVFDILTVSQIILNACLARKSSAPKLEFFRTDDNGESAPFICIRQEDGQVRTREVALDYAGDLRSEYERHNQEDIMAMAAERTRLEEQALSLMKKEGMR